VAIVSDFTNANAAAAMTRCFISDSTPRRAPQRTAGLSTRRGLAVPRLQFLGTWSSRSGSAVAGQLATVGIAEMREWGHGTPRMRCCNGVDSLHPRRLGVTAVAWPGAVDRVSLWLDSSRRSGSRRCANGVTEHRGCDAVSALIRSIRGDSVLPLSRGLEQSTGFRCGWTARDGRDRGYARMGTRMTADAMLCPR
jgi:hypothetical protein